MIFDFHCHYSRSFFRYREYEMNPQTLLREMEKHGVEPRAILGENALRLISEVHA